ncbi:MAG TPA: 2-dehydro-3-deoxygalactonokinase [Steroidobacteraceae bacterium]|nr:2-dehydro-3-deoxygalactonokinase [Steroidobacteraceae bacterium]
MTRIDSSRAACIAGDWGTSNLRLMLCDADGGVLEAREGPGAAAARGRFAEVFDAATADWRRAHGGLPAVLGGMVGSTFGWREASYLPCPARLAELAARTLRVRDDVRIVPGLKCVNPLGAPDFMRGEETQLLGALRLHPGLDAGRRLVCMPGTHTKWVALADGTVQNFLTVPTGELFALLCEHSVLVREATMPLEHRDAEFGRGLAEAALRPEVPLPHRLFQARSLRLDQQLSAEGAPSWLSGLLIGTDVRGALPLFGESSVREPVHVIGMPRLVATYSTALRLAGRAAVGIDGAEAARHGLTAIFRHMESADS